MRWKRPRPTKKRMASSRASAPATAALRTPSMSARWKGSDGSISRPSSTPTPRWPLPAVRSQDPIIAAEILNDRVVPFYDEHGIRLSRMLTDRGTEFCGGDSHEYELYLAVEDIDHTAPRPRAGRTTASASVSIAPCSTNSIGCLRKKIYRTIDESQTDLDAWITEYNEKPPHQGRWCSGNTPMQTFLDGSRWRRRKLMAA